MKLRNMQHFFYLCEEAGIDMDKSAYEDSNPFSCEDKLFHLVTDNASESYTFIAKEMWARFNVRVRAHNYTVCGVLVYLEEQNEAF